MDWTTISIVIGLAVLVAGILVFRRINRKQEDIRNEDKIYPLW